MKKRIFSAIICLSVLTAFIPALPVNAETEIQIGDYLEMGTYYGDPILWRCVAYEKVTGVDEENGYSITDSTDTVTEYEDGYLPLMVSDKIICLKAFDANTSANSATGSHSRDLYEQRSHGSELLGRQQYAFVAQFRCVSRKC